MTRSESGISRHRSRTRTLILSWVALVSLAIGFGASHAAFAQDDVLPLGPDTSVIAIDAVGDPVVVIRSPQTPTDVSIAVGNQSATVGSITSMADSGRTIQTVLVIDNGAESSEFLDSFTTAARNYVSAAPVTEKIAVWTTGGGSKLRVESTDDHERVDAVLANLVTAAGSNHMWDAVRAASLDLTDVAPGSANVVVFDGSADTESISTSTEARGAVLASGASAFVVADDDPNVPIESLARLVSVSPAGGFESNSDPAVLATYGTSVSDVVMGTWLIGFSSSNLATENQIDISVDGSTFAASFVPGSVTAGTALEPVRIVTSGGIGLLQGDSGKLIGVVLGAFAIALAAYAMAMLFQNEPSALDVTLVPYTEAVGGESEASSSHKSAFSKSSFVKRAVEMTEGLAERQGILVKTENLLERAAVPLRVGEAISGYAVIALLMAVIGLIVGESVIAMIFFATLGLMVPPMVVKMRASRRRKKFMNQLPDTLQLLSSTLKAGYSFMQGVEAVAQEVEEPMAGELHRIVAETQLGRAPEESMDSSAERMDSNDFAWAVMAVRIQREVGGNLAELLLTVAETMTERERLRRDVASLTAEGKMSAIVLGLLPVLLGLVMWAMNREYIGLLFTDSFGKVLFVVSVISALAGFAWMKKMITIEI